MNQILRWRSVCIRARCAASIKRVMGRRGSA
jgi:hypothetical protein